LMSDFERRLRAAMIAARPTPPVPNTARLSPGPTASELSTAPAPVRMPQPRGARISSGTSAGTLTALRSPAIA